MAYLRHQGVGRRRGQEGSRPEDQERPSSRHTTPAHGRRSQAQPRSDADGQHTGGAGRHGQDHRRSPGHRRAGGAPEQSEGERAGALVDDHRGIGIGIGASTGIDAGLGGDGAVRGAVATLPATASARRQQAPGSQGQDQAPEGGQGRGGQPGQHHPLRGPGDLDGHRIVARRDAEGRRVAIDQHGLAQVPAVDRRRVVSRQARPANRSAASAS